MTPPHPTHRRGRLIGGRVRRGSIFGMACVHVKNKASGLPQTVKIALHKRR